MEVVDACLQPQFRVGGRNSLPIHVGGLDNGTPGFVVRVLHAHRHSPLAPRSVSGEVRTRQLMRAEQPAASVQA
jgi:hypothetical protein